MIRATVLLNVGQTERARGRRQSTAEREAAVAETKAGAAELLPEIDRLLGEVGGRRLSQAPDALGTILVETTRAGLRRLSASSCVKAVLEDQPLIR
jgi:hypothetical protein